MLVRADSLDPQLLTVQITDTRRRLDALLVAYQHGIVDQVAAPVAASGPQQAPAPEPSASWGLTTDVETVVVQTFATATPGVAAPDGVDPSSDPVSASVLDSADVTGEQLMDATAQLAALLDPSAAFLPVAVTPAIGGEITPANDTSASLIAQAWAGYANGQIPVAALCELASAPGQLLRCDAAAQFDALAVAFTAKFGHSLVVSDAYRTFAQQAALKAQKPYLAAVPGTSMHGWGLAVDLGGGIGSGSSAEYAWLRSHAPAFGWDNPAWARPSGIKPEPWHFEYVAAGPQPYEIPSGRTLPAVPEWATAPAPLPRTPRPTATPATPAAPTPRPTPTRSPTPTEPVPTEPPSPTPSDSPTSTPGTSGTPTTSAPTPTSEESATTMPTSPSPTTTADAAAQTTASSQPRTGHGWHGVNSARGDRRR